MEIVEKINTVAFIPVRGGSKGIPGKNVKHFNGKPLVFWSIDALLESKVIDDIVVASDSDDILMLVKSKYKNNVKTFKRSSSTAQDESTTESAMLEYIESEMQTNWLRKKKDIFILVQATSPLTRPEDFVNALEKYKKVGYDSMLSCVKTKRFFWTNSGNPINYDYTNRPRRQDFDGTYMENGAFYISRFINVWESKNRLSGNVGIYELPEWMSGELDSIEDWAALEKIESEHRANSSRKIKAVFIDVDGTLTDGGMCYTTKKDTHLESVYESKTFNAKDGMAFRLLNTNGIKSVIITGENSELANVRAEKVGASHIILGKQFEAKLEAALEYCNEHGIELEEVACIGDDINDIPLMEKVGLIACPHDAAEEVKRLPGMHIMNANGGHGAVREFVEHIINMK